jgi:ferredoxin
MTPFGLRKKLRGLLGGLRGGAAAAPAAAAPAPRKYTVRFEVPDGSSYATSARHDDSLVMASGRGPQPIATGCSDSTCGTCQVEVLEGAGALSPRTEHEAGTAARNKVPDGLRLGCQTHVIGDGVRVRIVNVLGAEG